LAGGVDVWINTPRRPWEASGTSGMKVLVNGALNLSELDGWWAEAYAPDVGWAIGDGRDRGDDPAWDAFEAESVYTLLEQQVIPEFYQRDSAGIPTKWVERIRHSMARLTPRYSAHRVVREYTESHYIPAAAAYSARAAKQGKCAGEISTWQQKLESNWREIAFGPLSVKSTPGHLHFEIPVHFGGLDPDAVRVELYATGVGEADPVRINMDRGPQMSSNYFVYATTVGDNRNANDYTPRVVPYHPGASVPLEADQILWQK
jgi:starch phosphorylase